MTGVQAAHAVLPLRSLAGQLATPWTVVLAVPVAVALLDPPRTGPVIAFAVWAFLSTLPYIVLAVLLIAWLKAAGAEAVIGRAFEGREIHMIVFAALFGGLAPFCSCEVIPFIAGLLAVGAPLSAIMAFWLASPAIDPPTLFITAGALGWSYAIAKALSAIAIGLLGGFVVKALASGGLLDAPARAGRGRSCGCGAPPSDGRPVWRFWRDAPRSEVFAREIGTNALFLAKWLALAYIIEALLVTYVPADLIAGLVGGDGIGSIMLAGLVGMPAYLNSYVAPPLVAGLVDQGMSPGAAMAFMLAGAVSSVPAMAGVWSLVRPPVFATYLGLGLAGAVLAGLAFQIIAF